MKKIKFLSIVMCLALTISCFGNGNVTKAATVNWEEPTNWDDNSENPNNFFDFSINGMVDNLIISHYSPIYYELDGENITGFDICENLNLLFGTKTNKDGVKFKSLTPSLFSVKNNKKIVIKNGRIGVGFLEITLKDNTKKYVKICEFRNSYKKWKYKRIGKNKIRFHMDKYDLQYKAINKNLYKVYYCVEEMGLGDNGKTYKVYKFTKNNFNLKLKKNRQYFFYNYCEFSENDKYHWFSTNEDFIANDNNLFLDGGKKLLQKVNKLKKNKWTTKFHF